MADCRFSVTDTHMRKVVVTEHPDFGKSQNHHQRNERELVAADMRKMDTSINPLMTQVARRWLLPCAEVYPIRFDPKTAKFRR